MSDKEKALQVEYFNGDIEEYKDFRAFHVFGQGVILEYENREVVIPYSKAKEITLFGGGKDVMARR